MMKTPFTEIRNSIRTHLGLLTGIVLLVLLFVFYIGGRYILINIVRQAEQEVTTVSNSIKSVISQQVHALQDLTQSTARSYEDLPAGQSRTDFL
jgi:sensor domain CHASE-containing protein